MNRVNVVEKYSNDNAQQINDDKQTNSQYNNRTLQKKQGLFAKKRVKDMASSTESETLWREVNLFWPETIAIVAAGISALILMFVVRFMSATGLELIKDMLTEQAYLEVASLISNMNTLFIGVSAIPFLVLIGFYAYRLFVFTPRKDRFLVARVKRTGAIRFSVDQVKDHEVIFEKGISTKMTINNPRKHWFENLGKPFIFLFEGDDCNADLNELVGNVSNKAKEINTVNENAISYGRRIEKYIQEQKDNIFSNPMFYMMLAMLAILVIVGFIVLKQPEQIQAMLAGAGA